MSSPPDLTPLSPNTLDEILALPDGRMTLADQPLVQILSIRAVAANRFRVIISDGMHFMQALVAEPLTKSLAPLIDATPPKNAIAALEAVYWFPHNGPPSHYLRRFLFIEALHFVEDRTQRIGGPVSYPIPSG